MKSWPLFERKRSLAFITCSERKIAGRRALAIRQSEKRFKTTGNIKMELVKKMAVTQSLGGLVDQDCTAFLSNNSEDDQVELGVNSQRHLSIVLPLSALKSRDITDLTDCKYLPGGVMALKILLQCSMLNSLQELLTWSCLVD